VPSGKARQTAFANDARGFSAISRAGVRAGGSSSMTEGAASAKKNPRLIGNRVSFAPTTSRVASFRTASASAAASVAPSRRSSGTAIASPFADRRSRSSASARTCSSAAARPVARDAWPGWFILPRTAFRC